MRCEACTQWTPGTVIPFTRPEQTATYGLCKPARGALPFWAARYQPGMQTNTQPREGASCAAFSSGKPN